jgi:hypothetical protein
MLPVFTLVLARDAVARQFDYDDAPTNFATDVAPAARPRRRRFPILTRRRFRGAIVPTA